MDAGGFLSESVINDPLRGDQSTAPQHQATALLSDDSGIVAYSGRGTGDTQGIYLRRVDSNGEPIGEAIRANTTHGGNQQDPSILVLDDDTAIVAWSGRGDGDAHGVFARRIDASGKFLSSELMINETARGIQTRPVIAQLASGDIAIAWTGRGVGDRAGVFVRQFNRSGVALTDETRVNTANFGIQSEPQIVATPDGGFAVAWSGTGPDDNWGGVAVRRFNADGVATSDAVGVNATIGGLQISPDLVVLPGGELLVVWSGRGRDDSFGVFARTIDSSNRPSSPEIRVNTNRSGLQYGPAVAAADDGSFLVLWTEFGVSGYDTTVKGRHFQSIALPPTEEFTLPITESGLQYAPSVTGDSRGGYLASWTRQKAGSEDVYARRMPPPTAIDTDPPLVTLRLTNDTGESDTDAITSDISIAGTIADASAIASLTVSVAGELSDASRFFDELQGTFTFTDVDLRSLFYGAISDGQVSVLLSATDAAGNASNASELTFTVDTEPPDQPSLSGIKDSAGRQVLGGSTSEALLSFSGRAEPLASVELLDAVVGLIGSTAADASGFWTVDIDLESASLQTNNFSISAQAIDIAGNTSVLSNAGTLSLLLQPRLRVAESTFDSQAAVTLPLPDNFIAPTLHFDLDAQPDTTARGFATEDVLGIYVVDANDPTRPLLDGNDGNASLLTISGDNVDFDPSLVRFDGRTVEVDLSSLVGVGSVRLVVQWINSDTDLASTAMLTRIAIDDDSDAHRNPSFEQSLRSVPSGPAMDLDEYTVDDSLTAIVGDVRIDPASGLYRASLRVKSDRVATGRRVAVAIPGLATGIEVVSASLMDSNGVPYLNLAPGILSGGIDSFATSAPIDLTIRNPAGLSLNLQPIVYSAGPNAAPIVHDPGPLSVVAGGYLEADFSATDRDGDLLRYSIRSDSGLPIAELTSDGKLTVTPAPGQEGLFSFDVVVSDGFTQTIVPVSLTVRQDTGTTTRISGVVLNTLSQPLAAIPIEFGGDATTTDANGRFEVTVSAGSTADAIFVRGEAFTGAEVYPFIAEKIRLLLGRDLYRGAQNVIGRPIYLPALDVANGQTIDPNNDQIVTTPTIPGAAVFVQAGSLSNQSGQPFTGVLSITEVPAELTPAALPEGLFTDLVVTIQPGEMVFETPAPLTLPNRAGHKPGTEMILWSINPVTGEFDQVGTGRVSADGTVIETISGGIRNSSWHDFSTTEPKGTPPDENDNNPDKDCDDCENRHHPQRSDNNFSTIDDRSVNRFSSADQQLGPSNSSVPLANRTNSFTLSPGESNGFASWSGGGAASMDGTVRDDLFGVATASGNYIANTLYSVSTADGSQTIDTLFPPGRIAGGAAEPETPLSQTRDEPATSVSTHAGALHKTHSLAAYNSLGTGRAVTVVYDSERADPRPIVHAEVLDPSRNIDSPVLVSHLTVFGGAAASPLRQDNTSGLAIPAIQTADQYRSIETGLDAAGTVHQINELADYPSGRYGYTSTMRISGANNLATSGLTTSLDAQLVHVNTINSPLGSGWGIAGYQQLVPNFDGSVLLIDGDGGESVFEAVAGTNYYMAAGDFSRLYDNGDGTFRRVLIDQTVYQFNAVHQLESVADRNGNVTLFDYDLDGRLQRIVDPVGLATSFEYSGDFISVIIDPINRRTEFQYDGAGNLIQITDPDTTTRVFDYDREHRLIGETNKNGDHERIEYDLAGRVSAFMRADGSTIRYAPAQSRAFAPPELTTNAGAAPPAVSLGQQAIAAVADANGNVTSTRLDRAGQTITESDGSGELPSFVRNTDNRITEVTDGRGNKTFLTYDDRGNVTSVSDPIARGPANTSLFQNRVYRTGDDPTQVIAHDINADGWIDALVADEGSGTVVIHPGRGDGTFDSPGQIAVGSVRSLVVADINADGLDDIATANSNGTLSIVLALTAGQFADAVDLPISGLPNSIAAADLNGDDDIDLIVLSRAVNGVDVLLGNGDGTFADPINYAVSSGAVSFTYGDLDSDGILDIVTANRTAIDNISVLHGLGDGTFSATVDSTIATAELIAIRLGDADQDGNLDLLASDGDSAVWIAAGLGDGNFAPPNKHDFMFPFSGTPTDPPTSILELSDINVDGNVDLIVAQPSSGGFNTFLGNGEGDFTSSEAVFLGGNLSSLTSADFNADKNQDVIVVNQDGRFVSVKLSLGEGRFIDDTGSVAIGIIFDAPPDGLEAVDIDGDSLVDLIAYSGADSSVTVFRNDGIGAFDTPSIIHTDSPPTSVQLRDFDDDGKIDYLTLQPSTNELQLLFGDGTASADGVSITVGTVDQPSSAEVGDFDRDGIADMVVAGASEFHVLIGDGTRGFVPATPVSLAAPASQIVVGDFNGDGNPDLALGGSSPSETYVSIRLGIGDGSFANAENYSVGGKGTLPEPLSDLLTFDANGDGNLDLIATDPSTDSLRVLIGTGDGTFAAAIATPVGDNPVDVSVVDLNGDGVSDVAVAASADGMANVLLGVGDGTFIDRQDYFIGPNSVGIALIDVLANGSPNIYSAGFGSNFLVTIQSKSDSTTSGKAKVLEYDPQFSQVTRLVDELGNETLIVIDPVNGNALSMTRVIGEVGGDDDLVTEYSYTTRGQIDTVTDPLGRVTDYDYDLDGRLIATTFAVGSVDQATRAMQYDAAGNLTAMIDELGHQTEYQFDVLNRLVVSTDPDPDGAGPLPPQTRTYTYDDYGNVVMIKDALSGSIEYQYDDEHRLITKTDSDGNSWRYVYDETGNLRDMIDRLDRRTSYSYDDRNRISTTIDPAGAVQRYLYDADDNPVRRFDKNGNVWLTEYDARNRIVREIDPLGHSTSMVYDRADNVIATSDSLSRRTEFEYDDAYRLLSLTEPDPDGPRGPLESPVYSFGYDQASNQTLRTDPLGNQVVTLYDARNRPVMETLTDPDGSGPLPSPVYRFDYDDANRLIEVLDPISRLTTYVYDDLNRLVSTRLPDPDGPGPDRVPTIVNSYDVAGNLVATVDPLGNMTTYVYDSLYRLDRRIDPDPDGAGPLLSPVTTFTYDAESQLTSVTDPLMRTVVYQYDPLGRVISETYPDPDGAGPDSSPVVSHTYDLVGNRLSTTDPLGNVTRFEYDGDDRMVRLISPDPDGPEGIDPNPVTSFVYDAADQLLDTIDPLGRIMSYEYDDLGRVIRETYADPDGDGPLAAPVMTYVFDAIGNEVSMTDALGNTTDYVFDHLYRRTDVMLPDPDGVSGPQGRPTTHVDYDIVNRPIAATDPLGRRTEFFYDPLDRIVREVYPDPDGAGPLASPEMSYRFDLVGNRQSMTDAVGSVTNFAYDNLYRLTSMLEADPDGPSGPLASPVTSYTYDVASQLRTVSDPLGRTLTNDYDNLGRVIRAIDPDPDADGPLSAPVTTYVFDLVGNQLSMTDPIGHVTRYSYDDLYRRVSQVNEDLDGPLGALGNPQTTYTYDLVGNLTKLTDPLGNTTRWQFDNLDRNIRETITLDGADVARSNDYDAMGNLIRKTDRNDRVIEYDYDAIYRPISERWLDENLNTIHTIGTVFDEANQILASDDDTSGSRYVYAYDRLGRIVSSTVNNGGSELVVSSDYDAQSRRISQTMSIAGVGDHRNDYGYDSLHRLTSLVQTGVGGLPVADKRFDFDYNAASQLVSIDRYSDLIGSTLISSSRYAYDGQARMAALQHSDSSAASIAGYTFTYDVASRIVDVDSVVDGPSRYGYDNGDQLTDATHASQSDEAYQYDENGNRTLLGYQTGQYNRLLSDGQFDYQYDNEGNRILRTNINTGAVTEYSWDHRNRLVTLTDRDTPSGAANQFVKHRYDAFNRWISTSIDSDGDGPVPEVITRYEYDGNHIALRRDATGDATDRYAWGVMIDQILSEEDAATGETAYPLGDHLGTVRDITDASGNVVNHIQYDSYGNVKSETDATIEMLFGYTGKPLDESTGLQNNRHRWYDAQVGRWTSEDSIGFAAGDTNLNRYAGNRPTTAIDPTGQVIFVVHGINNRNIDEIQAVTDILGGEGSKRQEVVHFIYGRGRDPEDNFKYPHEPTAKDAWQNIRSPLNQAAGRELARIINMTQISMNASGIKEPIHVIGYSNGSNVVYEMGKHLQEKVDTTLIIGGSIKKFANQNRLAEKTDNLHIIYSPADGATKLSWGVGNSGTYVNYDHVPNILQQKVLNVFHSLNEARSSHPLMTAESDTLVRGKVGIFTEGWKYDLLGFADSFTYDEEGFTYATSWLTQYMAEKYYAPLLGLGFGEDNRFSRTGMLPNGVRYNKCDTDPIEYVYSYFGE